MGKKIRSPFRVILFSRSLSAPLPPSPLLSSFFSSEVQRDTSCARLAARDYHTICIPSSLPLDYYFPAIPANSRPLDREKERKTRKKKRKIFTFSSSFLFKRFSNKSIPDTVEGDIHICIYIYTFLFNGALMIFETARCNREWREPAIPSLEARTVQLRV